MLYYFKKSDLTFKELKEFKSELIEAGFSIRDTENTVQIYTDTKHRLDKIRNIMIYLDIINKISGIWILKK